ncbi:ATP-binding protein [Nonomuraea sp. KM90]|uniref:ATP-binding protein n=1 Tax=Nonomuraea sp. KM90 TaxID=3457428 RepID=UPI003FCEDC91
MTTNPSVWVQGEPGIGKSAMLKRLCLGLVAYGYQLLCPGDLKSEYTPLVAELGGQVVRIGRGLDAINPLDSGPLGRNLHTLAADQARRIRAELDARRGELLHALLATPHGLGRRPAAEESAALNTAVRLAADGTTGDPVIPDVITVLRQGPQPLRERILAVHDADYLAATRSVTAALENMCDGPMSGMFDRPTSVQLDLRRPALSIDLSALRSAGEPVAAAGLLACWAYSYGAVDIARVFGLLPRPLVLPLDEMWRVLRAGPGMVDAMDAITRLNRSNGEISLMSTHSVRDLEALPTEEDRAKAAGLMERCDILILAAMPLGELRRISEQKPLTSAEIDLIASWAAATSTGLDGTSQIHPGRGKYLIKIGQRLGVPVRMQLTPAEQRLFDTDDAMRTVARGAREQMT